MTNLCLECKYVWPSCFYDTRWGSIDRNDHGKVIKCSNYISREPPETWEVKVNNIFCPYHLPYDYVKNWAEKCARVGECSRDKCPIRY